MAELLVKISYYFNSFYFKVVLNYSPVKGFHIYDIDILISVHVNCIDSIYADHLGELVV